MSDTELDKLVAQASVAMSVQMSKVAFDLLIDLAKERNKLRAELDLHRSKANGEYWAWQGDGNDHLESLVCPVLIPAKSLAALLNFVR